MTKDNIAEWTGEVPARFHTPFDTGSIPVSAIDEQKVSTTLFSLISRAGLCFFDNVGLKRVAHRTNSLHAGALLTVRGEGQRLNGSRLKNTANLSRLIKKLLDDFCSVVEISRFGTDYEVMI